MEYMTARAQPTPKTKPKKNPMAAGRYALMIDGVYKAAYVEFSTTPS
jgi:hypothetical protein